jgi:hypothetical protein
VGLFSGAELDSFIASEFNPVRVAFHEGAQIWTRDVLNLGVSPVRLVEGARAVLECNGGQVLEEAQLEAVSVHPDGCTLTLAQADGSQLQVGGSGWEGGSRLDGWEGRCVVWSLQCPPRHLCGTCCIWWSARASGCTGLHSCLLPCCTRSGACCHHAGTLLLKLKHNTPHTPGLASCGRWQGSHGCCRCCWCALCGLHCAESINVTALKQGYQGMKAAARHCASTLPFGPGRQRRINVPRGGESGAPHAPPSCCGMPMSPHLGGRPPVLCVQVTSQLLVDCMGHASPIVRQARWGKKPDGVCAVVGSMAEGPWPNNTTADVIATNSDLQPETSRVKGRAASSAALHCSAQLLLCDLLGASTRCLLVQ